MKVLEPGHLYRVDFYDRDGSTHDLDVIRFMKREGENYPGNVGTYSGTNCQELLRVLIDRMKYLQTQISCNHNEVVIQKLRECLWLFEDRAADRHGLVFNEESKEIELKPTCLTCGHIICRGHQ